MTVVTRRIDSTMKPPNSFFKRAALFIGCLCACASLAVFLWTRGILSPMNPVAARSFSKVYCAFLASQLTGSYWINEVESQAEFLAAYPDADRILFYRNVIRKIPMMDSNATLFMMAVGDDSGLVEKDMQTLQNSPAYSTFSQEEKVRIQAWSYSWPKLSKQIDQSMVIPKGTPANKR